MRDAITRSLRPEADLSALNGGRPATGDFDLNPFMQDWTEPNQKFKRAAVLVPIVEHADAYTVLLTQRTDHLKHHAGQVSFPGGRVEAQHGAARAGDFGVGGVARHEGAQRRRAVGEGVDDRRQDAAKMGVRVRAVANLSVVSVA